MRTLIIGCGYTGEALGKRLFSIGHEVSGILRNKENNARLIELGITPLNLDITKTSEIQQIPNNYDNIIISVSSSRGGLDAYKNVFGKGMINISNWLQTQSIKSVVFISSTSVYRETDGEWVNEESETKPTSPNGVSRLNAEKSWMNLAANKGLPIQIFRLSGIYSDQRNILSRLKLGQEKIIDKKNHFFSRIHIDDIANILFNSLKKFKTEEIYNISDDKPASSKELILYGSQILGIEKPETVSVNSIENEMLKNFYKDSKKVSNKKMKNKLLIKLKYPTYREGLRNIFNNFR